MYVSQAAEVAELLDTPKISAASEALAARARERMQQQGQQHQDQEEKPDAQPQQETLEVQPQQTQPQHERTFHGDNDTQAGSDSEVSGQADTTIDVGSACGENVHSCDSDSQAISVSEANEQSDTTDGASACGEGVHSDTFKVNIDSTAVNASHEDLEMSIISKQPLMDLYHERLELALQESGSNVTTDELVSSPASNSHRHRLAVAAAAPCDDRFDDRADNLMMEMAHVEEILAAATGPLDRDGDAHGHAQTAGELEGGNDDNVADTEVVESQHQPQEGSSAQPAAEPTPDDAPDVSASLKQIEELTVQMNALDAMACEPPVKLRNIAVEAAQTVKVLNALHPSVPGQEIPHRLSSSALLANSSLLANSTQTVELCTSGVADRHRNPTVEPEICRPSAGAGAPTNTSNRQANGSDNRSDCAGDELSDDRLCDVMEDLPDIPNSPAARTVVEESVGSSTQPASPNGKSTVWEDAEDEKWKQLVASPALQPLAADTPQQSSADITGDHATAEEGVEFRGCCHSNGLDVTSATDSTMDNTFLTAISDSGSVNITDSVGGEAEAIANEPWVDLTPVSSGHNSISKEDPAQTEIELPDKWSALSTSAELSAAADSLSEELLQAAVVQPDRPETAGESPRGTDDSLASVVDNVFSSTLRSSSVHASEPGLDVQHGAAFEESTSLEMSCGADDTFATAADGDVLLNQNCSVPVSEPEPEPEMQPAHELQHVQRYQIVSPDLDLNSSSASSSAVHDGDTRGIGSYLPSKYLSYSPDDVSTGSAEASGQPTPDASPAQQHSHASPGPDQLTLDVVCPEGIGPGQLLRVRVPSAELQGRHSQDSSQLPLPPRTASLEVQSAQPLHTTAVLESHSLKLTAADTKFC